MSEQQIEEIEPECKGTVNVTTLKFQGTIYTISTTEIMSLKTLQRMHDLQAGYEGETGNYETMLFINQDSLIYPFGYLPGHPGLGVFQRYETEDEAYAGHQAFVKSVKGILSSV